MSKHAALVSLDKGLPVGVYFPLMSQTTTIIDNRDDNTLLAGIQRMGAGGNELWIATAGRGGVDTGLDGYRQCLCADWQCSGTGANGTPRA